MNYEIIWKGEVVDTAETIEDAKYLVCEYSIAYGGSVSYKKI